MKLDVSSLAHTKWECKYHIVFAPKYRRQIIYGKIKQDIGQMLRKLCEYKGIVNALYDYMTGAKTAEEVSEIGISCENTRLVFAAERSRLNGDVETIVPLD